SPTRGLGVARRRFSPGAIAVSYPHGRRFAPHEPPNSHKDAVHLAVHSCVTGVCDFVLPDAALISPVFTFASNSEAANALKVSRASDASALASAPVRIF